MFGGWFGASPPFLWPAKTTPVSSKLAAKNSTTPYLIANKLLGKLPELIIPFPTEAHAELTGMDAAASAASAASAAAAALADAALADAAPETMSSPGFSFAEGALSLALYGGAESDRDVRQRLPGLLAGMGPSDINRNNILGFPAILYAVWTGKDRCVAYLLENGVQPSISTFFFAVVVVGWERGNVVPMELMLNKDASLVAAIGPIAAKIEYNLNHGIVPESESGPGDVVTLILNKLGHEAAVISLNANENYLKLIGGKGATGVIKALLNKDFPFDGERLIRLRGETIKKEAPDALRLFVAKYPADTRLGEWARAEQFERRWRHIVRWQRMDRAGLLVIDFASEDVVARVLFNPIWYQGSIGESLFRKCVEFM
tara:strand:+ start:620 stop:1741 length:1122 start_codon:yes stop_codon:yes gene_type:complete